MTLDELASQLVRIDEKLDRRLERVEHAVSVLALEERARDAELQLKITKLDAELQLKTAEILTQTSTLIDALADFRREYSQHVHDGGES